MPTFAEKTAAYSQRKARKQGWLVAYNVDADQTEIQRFDESSPFDGDESAHEFVKMQASKGDALAMAALALIGTRDHAKGQ